MHFWSKNELQKDLVLCESSPFVQASGRLFMPLNVCSLTDVSSSTDIEVFQLCIRRLLLMRMQYLHIITRYNQGNVLLNLTVLNLSPPIHFCFCFCFCCSSLILFHSLLFVVFYAGLKAYPALICSAALDVYVYVYELCAQEKICVYELSWVSKS